MNAWPLTSRGSGLLLAAGGAWLVSRMFGVAELAMAAVAILALVALAIAMTRLLSSRIEVRRRIAPAYLQVGQDTTVELQVRNAGRLRTATLWVDDRAPRMLARSSRFTTRPLAAGETVHLRYGLLARRRGLWHVGPTLVDLRDPFGIARRAVVVSPADDVVVFPRLVALSGGPPLAGHLGTGSDGPPRPGPIGDELATIREYVQGDDLRRVHWRSTAHRGRLMVRQEENRQRPEAVVVMDLSPGRHVVTAAESSFETMVTATASILWLLHGRQFRARLVDGPLQRRPEPTGWEHTVTRLAVADPSPLDMALVWRDLERGAAGEGSLVAVVPTPDPAGLRDMVRAGRTFGARVAVLVDPPPSAPDALERQDAHAMAAALVAAGWYATVITHEDDIATAWQHLATRTGGRPDIRTVGA